LNEIIPRHGVPRVIISDQGPQLTSEEFVTELTAAGTRLVYSTPYHHQANGLVERWNQTMMKMLKPLVELAPEEWDQSLNAALFAYRTAVHATTGDTPFYLTHGRDPDLPGENPLNATTRATDPRSHAAELLRTLSATWVETARHIELAQQQYKHYFDRRARRREFFLGDIVTMRKREKIDERRITNKFHPEFERLYRVVDINGPNLKLQSLSGANRPAKSYNMALCKHFGGSVEDYTNYENKLRAHQDERVAASKMDYFCAKCDGSYRSDTESGQEIHWIECDLCLEWFHFGCVDLYQEPVHAVWYCPDCIKRVQGVEVDESEPT
jgi:hypothetical protein